MKIHKLDIYPQYFQPILDKVKTFEIRRNINNFEVGDTLILREFVPEADYYTGRVVKRTVAYITDYAQKETYVVLGII